MKAFRQGILIVLALGLLSSSAQAAIKWPSALEKIIVEVKAAYARQERPTVVFDVDGTLFDNRPRTLKILHDYAEIELKDVRPEQARLIKAITLNQITSNTREVLIRAGVTEEAVVTNGLVFWAERFFTDEYLAHDVPVSGSVKFVRTLYSSGARIIYLTTRDVPRQLVGTVTALRAHGFPVGTRGTELMMKPSYQIQDFKFRQNSTAHIRASGKVIAVFDNEPMSINVYCRAFEKAACFWYAVNARPGGPPLLANVQSLLSFEQVEVQEAMSVVPPVPAPLPTPIPQPVPKAVNDSGSAAVEVAP